MNTKKHIYQWMQALAVFISAWMMFACNEKMEYNLTGEYPESNTHFENSRTLFVVIDGASGYAVNEAYNSRRVPNIRAMSAKSTFTFDGLADAYHEEIAFTKERGWANLLTGTTTHGVGVKDEDNKAAGIETLKTPSFLQRLKEVNPATKISLYASDPDFFGAFGNAADKRQQTATDENVKQAVIDEISTQANSPSDVIVVQFSDVRKAGENQGFYNNNGKPADEVLDAITGVDKRLGEILKALEARPYYNQENWLIVVTSSYGGNDARTINAQTPYDDPRLNIFSMVYNDRFSSKLLLRPSSDDLQYKFYSPYFVGPGQRATTNAVMTDNTEFFNMGKRWSANASDEVDKSGYTIQFRMIDLHYDPWGNRNILGKRFGTTGAGWHIAYSSNTHVEFYSNNRSGNMWEDPGVRRDKQWHSITVVIKEIDDTQMGDSMYLYVDGVVKGRGRTDGSKDMWNDAPLTVGHTFAPDRPNQANLIINDLQFYNVTLPPDFIAANHCRTKLDVLGNDYEYWNELVAYYPNDRKDDIAYPYLEDYSKYTSEDKRLYFNKQVGTFTPSDNVITRTDGSIISDNVCPLIDDSFYKAVFNSVDLSYQIFMWLGQNIHSSWNFEGFGRSLNFSSLNDQN